MPGIICRGRTPRWCDQLVVRIRFPGDPSVIFANVLVLNVGAGWEIHSN
jgi:hypothetical protein